MDRVDLVEKYQVPDTYVPPAIADLKTCTEYPNMNSIEYRHHQPDESTVDLLLPFYELLEANDDYTTIVLATNSYNSRIWNGSLFGYKQLADVGAKQRETFKLPINANITGIQFIDTAMMLLTDANGTIQLWSTQSERRNKNAHSLFNIAEKTEHTGIIRTLEIFSGDRKKAITGSLDGCIKVWDIESCDLISNRTYRYAHAHSVNGVSSKPASQSTFCSCSADRSFSVWDYRMPLPMVDSHENHVLGYTTCLWKTDNSGAKSEYIYLGDESGIIQVFDHRNIHKCIKTVKLYDRPIHKIKFSPNGEFLCVLAETNSLQILQSTSDLNVVYESSKASDFLRDVCWTKEGEKQTSFYSVGWNRNIHEHIINHK